jgi:choice-of-anchor C domain-containing protein
MLPVTLLLAAASPSAPVPKAAELVINGSFEDGPALEGANTWTPLDKESTAMKGWTVSRGQIDLLSTNWQAGEGKRSLDLHGSPGIGGVKQTIATKKGKAYTVTFQMAGNPGGTAKAKSLFVAAAGESKKFTFDATGKTYEDMGWETVKWEFTATADETELELYSAETTDEFAGPALDNVSVKEKK